jgi:single-stranded-DNA-specific exonuclease
MKRIWRTLQPPAQTVALLSRELHLLRATASILVNRGLTTPEAAERYLQPSLLHVRPPFELKGIDAAVERIGRALDGREKILLFGDYDVDGITATAILYEFLHRSGAEVDFYIPHRRKEGYSLQTGHVAAFAAQNRARLIITVDCGSTSHAAVKEARQSGIDVVVTDHHRVALPLPEAVAVVNPKRPDCDSGFEHLAGVGVALALIICLRKHLRDAGYWRHRPEPNLRDLCDLVALGTIADAVPLIAENRIFSQAGLDLIRTGRHRPGIKALLASCNLPHQTIHSDDLAFRLVPLLNAAGRMDHAGLAAELLMADREDRARRIAERLIQLNRQRKETETDILDRIQRHFASHPEELERRSLILAGDEWHEGVIGIVAARLVESFHRPVVLISIRDGAGKGSGRSIPGFNLYAGLKACADCLDTFGGHGMAAGLKIAPGRIPELKERFEKLVQITTTAADFVSDLCIDLDLALAEISPRLVDEIERLMPFGPGNPEPLFAAGEVRVANARIVGGNHRQMMLFQPGAGSNDRFRAIHFNVDPRQPPPERFDRLAFRLRWNHWNGRRDPQIIVDTVEPA